MTRELPRQVPAYPGIRFYNQNLYSEGQRSLTGPRFSHDNHTEGRIYCETTRCVFIAYPEEMSHGLRVALAEYK